VDEFLLDEYEVTNEDYQRFVEATGHAAPAHWRGRKFPPGEAKLPVVNVTWKDADDYARWKGKRLPSETEWEYAARGPDNLLYPWGDTWSPERTNSGEGGPMRAVTIDSYPDDRSPFGIYGMAGNVAEWVSDDYVPYAGASGAESQPRGGRPEKVIRGGFFTARKNDVKATRRIHAESTAFFDTVGFRCARDAERAP
jgi:formylglycine-generating enzyme required for sulfatase activity